MREYNNLIPKRPPINALELISSILQLQHCMKHNTSLAFTLEGFTRIDGKGLK